MIDTLALATAPAVDPLRHGSGGATGCRRRHHGGFGLRDVGHRLEDVGEGIRKLHAHEGNPVRILVEPGNGG